MLDLIYNINLTTNYFNTFYVLYNNFYRNDTDNQYNNINDIKFGLKNIYYDRTLDFILEYNNLYYIQKYTAISKYLNNHKTQKEQLIKIQDFLNDKINSILKYKYSNIYVIQLIELFKFTNLYTTKIINILDINDNPSSSLKDCIKYFGIKPNICNNLILLNYAKHKYSNNINNKSVINKYIDIDLILNNKVKYDIIQSNIRNNHTWTIDETISIISIQIFYLMFVFAINHLKLNGSFILHIGNIITKPQADILILGKKYFKEVIPYQSELKMWQYTGVSVVFKGFKGIPKKDFDNLIKTAKKLLKNDPTSINITINDDKIRKMYGFIKPKNPKYKQIKEFINLPVTSHEYDFIRDFNKKTFLKKILYLEEMLTYKKLYFNPNKSPKQIENSVPKSVRENQLIKSLIYAKEFDLDIIIDDKGTFNSNFGKLILKNLYTNHEPIKKVFVKVFTIMDLYKQKLILELERVNKEFDFSNYILESRQIPKMIIEKHKSLFLLIIYNKNIESL